MDLDAWQELGALMKQANDITVRRDTPEEETLAVYEFRTWLISEGLDGRLGRELGDDGDMLWVLRITTARGEIRCQLESPLLWIEALQLVGLHD